MPWKDTPTGIHFRITNLHYQLKSLRHLMTNQDKFGLKVEDIKQYHLFTDKTQFFSKKYNPFLRSYASADKFTRVNNQFLGYIRTNYKAEVKALWDIKPEMVASYVQTQLIEKYGMARQTLQQHSSLIGKLEIGIKEFLGYKNTDFGRKEIASGRWLANQVALELPGSEHHTAYKNTDSLISNLLKSEDKVFAAAQVEGGFRFAELQKLSLKNLKDITTDGVTGEERGIIHVQGKGGRERDCLVSSSTYERISSIIEDNGKFKVDYTNYLYDLQQASQKSNLAYSGNHALRYDFCQNRYDEYLKAGYSDDEALVNVSHEMGHDRIEQTEVYLGR